MSDLAECEKARARSCPGATGSGRTVALFAALALAACSGSAGPPLGGPPPTRPTTTTPPPNTTAPPTPGAEPAPSPVAAAGGAPAPDPGTPTGDAAAPPPPSALPGDGLQQLLVTSAIGLGYYTACHIMPGLDVRCFGDRHPRTMPPAGLKTRQMACAHDGCCALIDKGAPGADRIRCWSDKRTIFPPAAVAKAVDPIQIGIGYQHGC